MIDAVWHLRGSVPLDPLIGNETALDRIERLLDEQWKPIAERGTDFVAFTDPLWGKFSPNWLAMVAYDQGVFWIAQGPEGRHLRYRLRSLHGFIFSLFVSVGAFILGCVGAGVATGLVLGGLAFGWLYGMNLLLALIRVPSLIERTVAQERAS